MFGNGGGGGGVGVGLDVVVGFAVNVLFVLPENCLMKRIKHFEKCLHLNTNVLLYIFLSIFTLNHFE